jgi:hypothetical protein
VQLAQESCPPTWATWHELPAVIAYRPHLRRTLTIAFLVGSVFVLINQLGLLLSGAATLVVWLKAAASYAVPFCVSTTESSR